MATEAAPHGDVGLMAHVGYDIREIGPFLDQLEQCSSRLVVAVMGESAMTTVATLFWGRIHGEPRVRLPAMPELLVLLAARGRVPAVMLVDRAPPTFASIDEAFEWRADSSGFVRGARKDELLRRLVEETVTAQDGRYSFDWAPTKIGIISWNRAPRLRRNSPRVDAMDRSFARTLAVLAISIGALVGAPKVQAGGAPPATKWAWVVVRNATSSYNLTPGRDAGNSAGMTNHVLHAATGIYGVAFDGVGGTPGTFLVSAFGTTPRVCLASEYANNAGPAQAEIHCNNLAGQPANATFVVNWLTASGSGFIAGEFGFGLSFCPSRTCVVSDGHENRRDEQIRLGAIATSSRTSTNGLVHAVGRGPHLQLRRAGSASRDATAAARHCQIGGISKKTTPQRVKVLCFNLSGNPVNAKFVVAYAH